MSIFIGIAANISEREFLPESFMKQYSLNSSYVDAVRKAGGIPIILPIANDENIKEYGSIIDGLLLVGGRDVNPKLYDEEIIDGTSPVLIEKDNSDILYLKEMLERKKPIFGICRGMQILNIVLGGTLYQDLRLFNEEKVEHFELKKPFEDIHSILIKENSVLDNIMGKKVFVNSIHHQSIKRLGKDLVVIAEAEDGTIEAIENKEKNILGVQWHPELLVKSERDEMLEIFEEFIKICKNVSKNN